MKHCNKGLENTQRKFLSVDRTRETKKILYGRVFMSKRIPVLVLYTDVTVYKTLLKYKYRI